MQVIERGHMPLISVDAKVLSKFLAWLAVVLATFGMFRMLLGRITARVTFDGDFDITFC